MPGSDCAASHPPLRPTRAALLTGLYSQQAGMGWLDNKVEPKSRSFHGND